MADPTHDADTYRRMARAIRFLAAHRDASPSLAEAAASVHLSPHHFQRLFSRWAGVSPKRFLQHLTLEEARRLLREGRSVLDATYEVGLSAPSRLHDLFVTLDAMTPGEFKRGGEGLRIEVGEVPSPFGWCLLGVTERGVCWLSFADGPNDPRGREELAETWPSAEIVEHHAPVRDVGARIFGDPADHDGEPVPLLVGGTNFQLKVWQALLRIPPGRFVTYTDVACAIGRNRRSARAVGSAVGANPVSYLIPCHRVLRSAGTITGYRWGSDRKQALLAWETARSDG